MARYRIGFDLFKGRTKVASIALSLAGLTIWIIVLWFPARVDNIAESHLTTKGQIGELISINIQPDLVSMIPVNEPEPASLAAPSVAELKEQEWNAESLPRIRGPNSLALKFYPPDRFRDGIGIVDVNYLLKAHFPPTNSPAERTQAVDEIQRVVTSYAVLHGLVLVFDSSGESLNACPVLLSGAERFDLTAEVEQRLAQANTAR